MADVNEQNAIVKKSISYDPVTGQFTWLVKTRRRPAGANAGGLTGDGYVALHINNIRYVGHHLAWFFVHGSWPTKLIDHRNGDKADNRIENLREATHVQNSCNRRKRKDSRSRFKGVSWCGQTQKWKTTLQFQGQERTLGRFATEEEAFEVYKREALRVHGEFANFEVWTTQ